MLDRSYDYKIKLLKENGFDYTGDKYSHPIGLDIYCNDLKEIEDDKFENILDIIMSDINILQSLINQKIKYWGAIIKESKNDFQKRCAY